LAGLVGGAWRPGAVLALLHGIARELGRIVGNVLLTRRVGDTISVSELIDTTGVATLARSTSLTVDNDLSVEANRRGVVVLEEDVESIGKGGSRSLSPAGSAIDRDVLVLGPGEVVGTVHVSPVPVGRCFSTLKLLPRGNGKGLLTTLEERLGNTASVLLLHEAGFLLHGLISTIESSGVLVARIVLLIICGDVLLVGSPGIGRGGPSAISLDSDVVGTSDNSNEALLTEVLSPRVPDSPVLGTVFDTITDDGDIMDNVLVTSLIFEDTRGVVLKSVRDSDTAGNRSTLVDLLHHGFLTRDLAILIDLVGIELIRDKASFTGHAVLALEHG
jgi:hypothetical protein